MSEITQKLWDRARLEGLTEGRRQGRTEGRREGRSEGRAEGFGMLNKLIDKGLITPAAAAEGIGIDEAELMKRLAQAGN